MPRTASANARKGVVLKSDKTSSCMPYTTFNRIKSHSALDTTSSQMRKSIYVESNAGFDPNKVKKYLEKNNSVRSKPIKINIKEHFLVGAGDPKKASSLQRAMIAKLK